VTGVWNVGELGRGATAYVQVFVTVAETGPYTTSAAITASSRPDPNAADNSVAEVTLTPTFDADLTLSQSVGNPAPVVGSQTNVYLQVSNSGPAVSEGVVVAHALGAGLTIDSVAASQGSYDTATGVWSVGQLTAGSSAYVQVFVTVAETGAYTTSTAITASSRPDPNPADNSVAEVALTPTFDADLTLSQSVGNPVPVLGSQTNVYLQVSNSGPAVSEGVVVAHALGAGLAIDSVTSSQGSYDQATGVWNVGELDRGATAYVQVFVTVAETGAYTTSAAITASSRPDPNPADNSVAEVTLTPTFDADLTLSQSVGNLTPTIGSSTYVYLGISNSGPAATEGVVVTHSLGAGLTVDSVTVGWGSYDTTTGVWNVGTLTAGATAYAQVTVTVAETGAYTTAATITTSSQPDPDASNNNAAEITLVPP
jgi:hypothetical protein